VPRKREGPTHDADGEWITGRLMNRQGTIDGFTKAKILADLRRQKMFTSCPFQAGEPAWAKRLFSDVMGMEATQFSGLNAARPGVGL